MITCYLRYEVDPDKLADFEAYGAMWLDLMPRFGGIHHGYFLPSEGESDVALAMFSFPSLTAYEQYRKDASAALGAGRTLYATWEAAVLPLNYARNI
jgi:hypothetical protein